MAVNSAHAFVVVFQAKYAAHMVKTQLKAPAFLMLKADDLTQLHGDLRIGAVTFCKRLLNDVGVQQGFGVEFFKAGIL